MLRIKPLLTALAAVLATPALFAQGADYTPPGPPLAAGHAKLLGSAYSSPSQTLYFERYWNQVVAENASKWGSVEGTRDVMNWGPVDEAYNFAKAQNLPFRFHVLFWGAQQPSWLRDLPAAEQLEEIDEWLAAIAARYPDLDIIEVVNEPLHDPPDRNYVGAFVSNANDPNCGNYLAALGGYGTTGWDWVLTAFRKARAAFPQARLMLNDYSITNETAMTNRYVEIIDLLKAENLIDYIGIQGHAFEHQWVTPAGLKANLDTLAATGLPIWVTEFDINGATDDVQLAEYQRTFPVFWDHPGVHGMTMWGWRPGTWQTTAYLVQSNGAERSAMLWLKEYLNTAPIVATQNFTVAENAGAGTAIGTVAAHDWENGTLGTWTLTSVTPDIASSLVLNADTGALVVAPGATLAAGTYAVGVSVKDQYNKTGTGTVHLNVSNAPQKVAGTAYEFAADIVHANTNVYDQILITGANTTFRADTGQIVRASYIDLNDDIVQVEYTGPGTVTVSLTGMTPPALPKNYNQNVTYVKGHATITVEGATELSNLTVFTVGTLTAGNPALWKDVTYDGVADIALINIASPTNTFGGLRASNVSFWATAGNTGLNAPGVNFATNQPVNVHDISAQSDATPLLLTGTIGNRLINGTEFDNTILITGGDLAQTNGRAIQFGSAARLYMGAGTTSHSVAQEPKSNQGTFTRDGTAFTPAISP